MLTIAARLRAAYKCRLATHEALCRKRGASAL
nr:MAG TPA: hypothetical protein [Caudoviricetes sp.]DAU28780.1 MAG TPA: hypothetical protein [Caudoviricetes sp.]